jgi:hypothetical protein
MTTTKEDLRADKYQRLGQTLHRKMSASAKENDRSLAAEIRHACRFYLEHKEQR